MILYGDPRRDLTKGAMMSFRKMPVFLAWMLVAMTVCASGAMASGELEVISWTGEVKVDGEALEEGSAYSISAGATIETNGEGNLFGRYGDGSQIRLKEDSLANVLVVDPSGDEQFRAVRLRAGTLEYLADPRSTVVMKVWTIRGFAKTSDADFSVRVDAYEGDKDLSCVIVHNIDHITDVEGTPDSIMSILKEEVEVRSATSATMNPGSVLVLCPRLKRTLEAAARQAIEVQTVAIVCIREASPFREVCFFEF